LTKLQTLKVGTFLRHSVYIQIQHWKNIFKNIPAPKEYTVPMQEVICDNLIGLCVCVPAAFGLCLVVAVLSDSRVIGCCPAWQRRH